MPTSTIGNNRNRKGTPISLSRPAENGQEQSFDTPRANR
ncbi:hypothetical protein EMIT0P294_130076 [Pseudomonas sp. IT-P294]